MIDIRLNDNDDIDFFDNDLVLVSDSDEVIQNVKNLLKIRMGEFFAEPEMGLDRSDLLGKNFNEQYAATDITNAIQQDSRVTSVNSVSFTRDGRKLSCEVIITVDRTQEETLEVVIDD